MAQVLQYKLSCVHQAAKLVPYARDNSNLLECVLFLHLSTQLFHKQYYSLYCGKLEANFMNQLSVLKQKL